MGRVRETLHDALRQTDAVLLALCVASTLYGMVLIASATSFRGTLKYVAVQGLGLLIGGFAPTPYETYEVYTPTFWEVSIGLGIFAVGALVVTLLWKIALEMKREGGEPFELAE